MTLPSEFLDRAIAHRGLHDGSAQLPENSLAALDAAIGQGFGIEIDLQLSADGHAVMFHDDTLDRMTEAAGHVADRHAEDLGALALFGGSETIPTLAEVLDVVDARAPLLIELKDQTARPGGAHGPLEAATAAALKGYDGPVAIMSFNPTMVHAMAELAPEVPRGLTGHTFAHPDLAASDLADLNNYAAFDPAGASFVSHRWQDLETTAIERLKARGVPILCWTVKSAADEVAARRIADNITFEGYLPS
ncbi:MAG: glycerophosphodiester phosphodiesterase family protein [Pseudomonadota bacterium]